MRAQTKSGSAGKNFRNSFVLLASLIFANALCFAQSAELAKVKFRLTDFRNPSTFRSRYGLVEFSDDNKLLAASGLDRDINFYDLDSGKIKTKIESRRVLLGGKEGFNAFSFSPDGKFAVLQRESYTELLVYDIEKSEVIREIKATEARAANKKILIAGVEKWMLEMSRAPVSANWKNVLVTRNEGDYEIRNFPDGTLKYSLHHSKESNRFSDALKLMFLGGFGRLMFLLPQAKFSPDGSAVVVANGNDSPTIWNTETGALIAKLPHPKTKVFSAEFSHDSNLIATSSMKGIVSIWDAKTGKFLSSFGSEIDRLSLGGWLGDSVSVVTLGLKTDVRIWNAESGLMTSAIENSNSAGIFFNLEKKLVATVPREDKKTLLQVWDLKTGRLMCSVPRNKDEERVYTAIWNLRGDSMFTASSDHVKIWNQKCELVQKLEDAVYPVRFSRDGKLLATGGKNDVGFVWEFTN